jgi:hypothetical protein
MSLTDTFVKQVKPIKPNGDKYADGGGMHLLMKATAILPQQVRHERRAGGRRIFQPTVAGTHDRQRHRTRPLPY